MPKGNVAGVNIQILRVFRRPSKDGHFHWFSRAGFWVKDKNILAVDGALQVLTAATPNSSLSEIICQAVINEAKRVQKRNSNRPKGD